MISSFGVQHYLAKHLEKGNVLLAGDAAHIVSPIGGQGMNLGWIGAENCVKAMTKTMKNPEEQAEHFSAYSSTQQKIAKQVTKRAEINMWLGRKESSSLPVKWFMKLLLKRPLSGILARIFTMHGLGRWWI